MKFKIEENKENVGIVTLKQTACVCIEINVKTIAQITDKGFHIYSSTLSNFGLSIKD